MSRFILIILGFFSVLYGNGIECPHGCGDPDRDGRIEDIKETVSDMIYSMYLLHEKEVKEIGPRNAFLIDVGGHSLYVGPFAWKWWGVNDLYLDDDETVDESNITDQ